MTDRNTIPNGDGGTGPVFVSIKEIGRLTGISRAHLYRLKDRGELRAYKVGRKLVVKWVDFQRFVAALPPATPGAA